MNLCLSCGHHLSFPICANDPIQGFQGTKHGEANPDDVVLVILLGELPYLRNCIFRTQVLPKVIFFGLFQVGIVSSRCGGGHQRHKHLIILTESENSLQLQLYHMISYVQTVLVSDIRFSNSLCLLTLWCIVWITVVPMFSASWFIVRMSLPPYPFRKDRAPAAFSSESWTTAASQQPTTEERTQLEGKRRRGVLECFIRKIGTIIERIYVTLLWLQSHALYRTGYVSRFRNSTEAGAFGYSTFSTSSYTSSCRS